MQHVLLSRFKRVRYYGWSSPAAHKRFDRIHALLDWKPVITPRDDNPPLPRCRMCDKPVVLVDNLPCGRARPSITLINHLLYA